MNVLDVEVLIQKASEGVDLSDLEVGQYGDEIIARLHTPARYGNRFDDGGIELWVKLYSNMTNTFKVHPFVMDAIRFRCENVDEGS